MTSHLFHTKMYRLIINHNQLFTIRQQEYYLVTGELKCHNWIGLCSVLRPSQHSIGYMGDGFYRSKDPTNSIKVLKEKAVKENNPKNRKKT